MWRPEGWKNPCDEPHWGGDNEISGMEGMVYEAGADAMLEALKSNGYWTDFTQMTYEDTYGWYKKYIYNTGWHEKTGTVIFIPEE